MPAIRISLAANNKQTNKTVVLLKDIDLETVRTSILDSAVKKLRVKKPSRVFLLGGRELVSPSDFDDVLENDITLLVSSGEDYVGNVTYDAGASTGPKCEVRVLATDTPIEEPAVKQLKVASELPGMIQAVGQPDLHQGNKFPIGCAFASRGWITPALIGGDIGCGINWYRTRLTAKMLENDSDVRKLAERLKGLEGAWLSEVERGWWLGDEDRMDVEGEEGFDASCGTIGKGNHFAEVQVVEDIKEYLYPDLEPNGARRTYRPPFEVGEVILLVHSGSRGYGQYVLSKQSKLSIKADSEEATTYLKFHDRACRWARKSRDLIAIRFLEKLERSVEDWSLDTVGPDMREARRARLEELRVRVADRKVMDIWHNNVEKVLWPPRPSASSAPALSLASLSIDTPPEQFHVYLHRKGAAPTTPNTPLLPLPGSRGTPTLMLHPLFTQATGYGIHNLLSVAHGAGRAMSRSKAANLAGKYKNNIEEMTQKKGAGWVICDDKELVWEEAPEAYKDVETVGNDMVKEGVCVIVGMARPKITYKVRSE